MSSSAADASPLGDGFLYSGNRHESVPRALFLDRRLTPLERNAWQVIRLHVQHDGISTFPTYEQLSPYLASMPCVPRASSETVARALTILRLTRWLSLIQRRRDKRTGRIIGNLYVLHDAALTPFEAIQLDATYLNLVSCALTHTAKAVQRIGYEALAELTQDPSLAGCILPTRLQLIVQRLGEQGWKNHDGGIASAANPSYPQPHESEEGMDHYVRNGVLLPSESEDGGKALENTRVPNPKVGRTRTVRINVLSEIQTTVPRAREVPRLPPRFATLRAEQQNGALAALQRVDASLRQAILDEWQARLDVQPVRNPAGYLFGIIGKALRGEFRPWQASKTEARPELPPRPSTGADSDTARAHLAHIRALLKLSPDADR